jgi:hypothetical protein
MWTLYTLQSGTYTAGTDWSTQFRANGTASTLAQEPSALFAPAIADGQSAQQMLYFNNWCEQSVYVGSATVGNPVQISSGGDLTSVTTPGFLTLRFPPGWSLYSVTRASDALDHRGLAPETPTATTGPTTRRAESQSATLRA